MVEPCRKALASMCPLDQPLHALRGPAPTTTVAGRATSPVRSGTLMQPSRATAGARASSTSGSTAPPARRATSLGMPVTSTSTPAGRRRTGGQPGRRSRRWAAWCRRGPRPPARPTGRRPPSGGGLEYRRRQPEHRPDRHQEDFCVVRVEAQLHAEASAARAGRPRQGRPGQRGPPAQCMAYTGSGSPTTRVEVHMLTSWSASASETRARCRAGPRRRPTGRTALPRGRRCLVDPRAR